MHDCLEASCALEAINERCPYFDVIYYYDLDELLCDPPEDDELPPPWNDPWIDIGGEG